MLLRIICVLFRLLKIDARHSFLEKEIRGISQELEGTSILRIHYALNIYGHRFGSKFTLAAGSSVPQEERSSVLDPGREKESGAFGSASTHTANINNDERQHFLPSDHTRFRPLVTKIVKFF